jgi:hypothetical protein
VNIKLETQRGALIRNVELAIDGEPPDVMIWGIRAFRYTRTDGVWDQKKHVYREATLCSLNEAGDAAAGADLVDQSLEELARASAEDSARAELDSARKITLTLTGKQADLLQRVRASGAFPNNKAALIAGLDAIDRAGPLSNDALLALLAKRLRGVGQVRATG